jgi:SRSO17 transposase
MTKPRDPIPTVAFVDDYCAPYRAVFANVRQFEQFTHLALGLVAGSRDQAQVPAAPRPGDQGRSPDPQAFHHFLAQADWSVEAVRPVRLELTRQALRERPFILCIDETGDRKQGKTTDYAASQYIGHVPTLANGVVSLNAYGVLYTVTVPLAFRLFKPRRRLQPGDVYKSKPQLAVELVQELTAQGFSFSVVLADRLYGERWEVTTALERLGLPYVVALRSPTTWSGRFPASGGARRAGGLSRASSPLGRPSSAPCATSSSVSVLAPATTSSAPSPSTCLPTRPGTS